MQIISEMTASVSSKHSRRPTFTLEVLPSLLVTAPDRLDIESDMLFPMILEMKDRHERRRAS
jgi:hypothetical protein